MCLALEPFGSRETGVGRGGDRDSSLWSELPRRAERLLGMYPGEAGPLGSECAGVVTSTGEGVEGIAIGDSVMALVAGGFSRFVVTDARLVARVPPGLSFEQAATIPVAFLTAWYALHDLAELKPGERLLVHAAAGGVGMAAVQIAGWKGAEVFGTASAAKWDVVRSVGVKAVAHSRDLSFVEAIRECDRRSKY